MSNKGDESAPGIDAPENRRWLIGIGITLMFGIFGAVMAVLSYSERTKPQAPAAAPESVAPGATGNRARNGRKKAHGRE